MVLGDTKGFQIQVQEIGSVYFVVVLDSSVGAVRAALSSFRIYLTGAHFPQCILYEVGRECT